MHPKNTCLNFTFYVVLCERVCSYVCNISVLVLCMCVNYGCNISVCDVLSVCDVCVNYACNVSE